MQQKFKACLLKLYSRVEGSLMVCLFHFDRSDSQACSSYQIESRFVFDEPHKYAHLGV